MGNSSDMKNKITPTKKINSREHGNPINEACGKAPNQCGKHDADRTYLINTKRLRVSSTKNWAKTLDHLRQQLKRGRSIDSGGLKDHFC